MQKGVEIMKASKPQSSRSDLFVSACLWGSFLLALAIPLVVLFAGV